MGRADCLRPGDDFILKVSCRVLSIEPVGATHVRVRVSVEDQPSISLCYDENPVLEFVCTNYRSFNSPDWGQRGGGWGGGGDEPVDDPPVIPVGPNLEPVE